MSNIKDIIKYSAKFTRYRAGNLYYEIRYFDKDSEIAKTIEFPVPITDIGDATFHDMEKGILMMRYIRKYLEYVNQI